MELIPGIRIFERPEPSSAPPRCWLSAGTTRADERPGGGVRYAAESFVPREPWRQPTASERAILWSRGRPDDLGSWVDVFRVPEAVLEPFGRLREAAVDLDSAGAVRELRQSPDCLRGIDRVHDFLRRLEDAEGHPFEGTGIAVQAPGRRTGTFDSRSGEYIGLHLDSWYRRELPDRAGSPNRICINLGRDDRHFLLINLPLRAIFEMLEIVAPADRLRFEVGTGLGIAFMRHFDSYPVVKLRIAPGEAYIAPTENMIHDGSTAGAGHLDLTLTVRGRFRPGASVD